MILLNAVLRKSQMDFGVSRDSEPVQLAALSEEHYCFFINICILELWYTWEFAVAG